MQSLAAPPYGASKRPGFARTCCCSASPLTLQATAVTCPCRGKDGGFFLQFVHEFYYDLPNVTLLLHGNRPLVHNYKLMYWLQVRGFWTRRVRAGVVHKGESSNEVQEFWGSGLWSKREGLLLSRTEAARTFLPA